MTTCLRKTLSLLHLLKLRLQRLLNSLLRNEFYFELLDVDLVFLLEILDLILQQSDLLFKAASIFLLLDFKFLLHLIQSTGSSLFLLR